MNAKTTRSILRRAPFLLAAAALWCLPGCGVDESSPSPALQGEQVQGLPRPAFVNPADSQVTRVELAASGDFDEASGEAQIFAVVRDQDGNSLLDFDFNAYNFTVTLNPGSAPLTLDPAVTQLGRDTVGDIVVALVIDSSGSMEAVTETGQTRMQVAKDAAKLFVGLMQPGDRTAVVDFSSDARTVQALTDDQTLLNTAIDQFAATGATNIGAAVGEAVRAVGNRPGRRAAVLLTDGDDTVDTVVGGPDVWRNNSASSRFQALQLAQKAGLRIYTVGLGDGLTEQGLADLRTFADETGGNFFPAPTAASLNTAFRETIPGELAQLPPQETFVLSFQSPIGSRPGKSVDVPFRLVVLYANANGTLSDKTSGAYRVP